MRIVHFKCALYTLGKPKLVSHEVKPILWCHQMKIRGNFRAFISRSNTPFCFFFFIYFFLQRWHLIKFLIRFYHLSSVRFYIIEIFVWCLHLFNIQPIRWWDAIRLRLHMNPQKKQRNSTKCFNELPVCLQSQNLNCQAANIANEKGMH